MGRKFSINYNDFSSGQLSRDYAGGDSSETYQNSAQQLLNVRVENGKSASKRAGTRDITRNSIRYFSGDTTFRRGNQRPVSSSGKTRLDNSKKKFFSFDNRLFMITEFGIFCEFVKNSGDFYYINTARYSIAEFPKDHNLRIFDSINNSFASRAIRLAPNDNFNTDNVKVQVEGNLCIIYIKNLPPFFIYARDGTEGDRDRIGTGYRVIPLHALFLDAIGNNLKNALPFTALKSLDSERDVEYESDYGVTFSVTNRDEVTSTGVNTPIFFIIQKGGLAFLLVPINNNTYIPVGLTAGSTDINSLGSGQISGYTLYNCDWGEQLVGTDKRRYSVYPERFNLQSRLTAANGGTLWSSKIGRPFEMFDFVGVLETREVDLASEAKKGSIVQLANERIVDIFKINDFFILTNRNIYSKSVDIIDANSKYNLVGSLSCLSNANVSVQDSSFFHLNLFGELFRTVFNFSENSFNSVNYSALVTFNGKPRFKNLFFSERYQNSIFCLTDDNRIFVLYFRNNEKIYAWSELSFDFDLDDVLIIDGYLHLISGDKVYQYDHSDNKEDSIFLDKYNVYDSLALFRASVTTSGNDLYINGIQYEYDISGNVNGAPDTITSIITGSVYKSLIKLMPLSPPDTQGVSLDLHKKIKEVTVRAYKTRRLMCTVNHDNGVDSVVTKSALGQENAPKDYIKFEGFSWSSEDINIELEHRWASYFKVIGITIKGMMK